MNDAAAQLRRILHLLPLLADDRAHPIDEVASAVGLDRAALLSDLRSLADRFDDPGGFVEGVSIFLDGERVSMHSSHFLRPMRLTRAELGALELGLAMLAAERPPEEQRAVARARTRLTAVLAGTPPDPAEPVLRAAGTGYPHQDDAPRRARIRRAIRDHRKMRLSYQKASAAAPEWRTISPCCLVAARGMWYLVAHADEGDGLRFFRLDRVLDAVTLDERFRPSAELTAGDLLRDGRMFRAEEAEPLVIRYSPRIARWIAEREGQPLAADGSLTLTHPLADADWAVRHVLQYGPDAEVLAPAPVREAVRTRLAAMLEPR